MDTETDEEVTTDDIGKGYEVAKNEYLIMDDEELEAVELESTHTIEIDQFVPLTQIDNRYYDQPYYIVPNDESASKRSPSSARRWSARGRPPSVAS